ncbi:MAG TPA: flagellar FlbD family protein [Candidatus Kapabacteria bacterium]|nr:flagellar FlbD family protein [Candidatus Kapabacteria bacterium]
MIRVIRIDGAEILLNSSQIEDLGLTPENITEVTMGTGEKIYVKNTPADILQKIDAYRFGMAEARREEDRERKKLEETEKMKLREKEIREQEKEAKEKAKELKAQEPEQEVEPDLEQEQNQEA